MPSFTVSAIAVASPTSSAVGTVRLTCNPEGVEVELVRAGAYRGGFSPGALARDVSFVAPYAAVRGLVRERRALCLVFDPKVVTPHSRFTLSQFSTETAELTGAAAARASARFASLVLPVPLGAITALGLPDALASGLFGRAAVGLLIATVTWLIGRELVGWLSWGGPTSDALRDAFEAEISLRLGLAPARVDVALTRQRVLDLATDGDDETPRRFPRAAVAALAFAVSAVVALLLFRHIERGDLQPPPSPLVASRLPRVPASTALVEPPALPACTCARADSPSWQAGFPTVAVLVFPNAEDGAGEVKPSIDARGRGRYELEVAAVNDSDRAVRDVRIKLTFARRNKRGERVGATDRGLFWEGALAPGKAVKWHVKAPGTEMRVDAPDFGTLEQTGLDVAPPDVAIELLHSRFRAVRLQAAKILTYARDPRAAEVVDSLARDASPHEAPILAELARAAQPVFACSVGLDADLSASAGESFASACVFNGTPSSSGEIELMDLAGATAIPIAPIAAHEGVRAAWPAVTPPGIVQIRPRKQQTP